MFDEGSCGTGLYVHVPFCASRCDYCAFATWTDRHHLARAYVDACVAEYSAASSGAGGVGGRDLDLGAVSTIFVGGGTPSQLDPIDLVRLLSPIHRAPSAEVTVEANPEDVTEEWLSACADAGVNRISLGVQSLDPSVLRGLGRRHDAAAVPRAVEAVADSGIPRLNVDLIYGGSGETDASWQNTLTSVLALEPRPSHVSAYALTVEPGTPLWRDAARHPDDDVQAARYAMADEVLSDAGLSWYEISNWSLPGHECRHNLNYWVQGDYRGIGCAAHSHVAGHRFWNIRTPERFIEAINLGKSPVAASETLSRAEQSFEALGLLLRTSAGVPIDALAGALEEVPALADLVDIDPDRGRAVLTLQGRLLANEVACRLAPDHLKAIDITTSALVS